jgi:branched-chain amino acid transport system substrate-binding protein
MKKIVAIVLVLVLALSLVACSSSKTIKIGVLSPTSGDPSVHGTPVKQSAELAAEEINAAGGVDGKMIEIVHYDTKGDGAEALNAYNRLRDKDKVVAVVGGTYSGATLGFKDVAVSDGMPVLTPTATNPTVTVDAPNVFRACYSDAFQGAVAAKFAIESLGTKAPGVLRGIGNSYAEGLADVYVASCEAAGLTVVEEGYTAENKDVAAQLTKLKEAGIDTLFIPDYANVVGPILQQAGSLGLDIPCLGADGWDGIELLYAAEAEGFYFINHYSAADESPKVRNFVDSYKAKHDGSTPNALGALGYDSVYMMAQAIEAAGSTKSEDIIAQLVPLQYAGVTGDISFDAIGDPVKKAAIIKVDPAGFEGLAFVDWMQP